MPFIVLEGLDGAGKSTQLAMLREYFAGRGLSYEYLHFPRFDSPVYGGLIARFLRGEFGSADKVDPYLVALLFAGDRADAAPLIRQWLDNDVFVITDRYVYSNIAFQCAKIADADARIALSLWIRELEFGYNNIPRPDVSLFLDVPFHVTEQRLAAARTGDDRDYLMGAEDIHEKSLDLQQKVREVYVDCASSDKDLKVIDCSGPDGGTADAGKVFGEILKEIKYLVP